MSGYWLGIDGREWDKEHIEIPTDWPRTEVPIKLCGVPLDCAYIDEVELFPEVSGHGLVRLKISGRYEAESFEGDIRPVLTAEMHNGNVMPFVNGETFRFFIQRYALRAEPNGVTLDVSLLVQMPSVLMLRSDPLIWKYQAEQSA